MHVQRPRARYKAPWSSVSTDLPTEIPCKGHPQGGDFDARQFDTLGAHKAEIFGIQRGIGQTLQNFTRFRTCHVKATIGFGQALKITPSGNGTALKKRLW